MGDLVEHRVLEEGVEGEILALIGSDEHFGDRHQDAVELGAHRILELEPPGALGELHLLVVGEVDGDGLGAGVGLSGVVEHVIGVEIGVGARRLALVFSRHGETLLQRRQQRGIATEVITPLPVLHQHVRLVRRLESQQLVVISLDRTDHDVDGVVLHLHPRHVARLVIVAQQRVGAEGEVLLESGIPALTITAHQGVKTSERGPAIGCRTRGGFEVGLGDVVLIKVGAQRHRAHPGQERTVAVEPIPRAIVDLGKAPETGVGDAAEHAVPRPRHLEPVDGVHLPGGIDQQRNHPSLRVAESAQVGIEPDGGVGGQQFGRVAVDRGHFAAGVGRVAGDEDEGQEQSGGAHGWSVSR